MLVALVLLIAACGDGGGDTSAAPTGPTSSTSSTSDPEETEATVAVRQTPLGAVLADPDGMTLYLFTRDERGEPTCSGGCAELWPPLTVEGDPAAGEGVDAALLGVVARGDGSRQVTYDGHPLYLYEPDEAPGDVKGHGVNDVWFAVSPNGSAAGEQRAEPGAYGY